MLSYHFHNNIDSTKSNSLDSFIEKLTGEKVIFKNRQYYGFINDKKYLLGDCDIETNNFTFEIKTTNYQLETIILKQQVKKAIAQFWKNLTWIPNKTPGIIFQTKCGHYYVFWLADVLSNNFVYKNLKYTWIDQSLSCRDKPQKNKKLKNEKMFGSY